MDAMLIILGLVVLLLMFQRWFWVAVFGVGALASAFAVLASIVHWQILSALGFTLLGVVLYFVTILIAASGD